ncbi:MAG: heavy metal translocating P-type ATPase metal-binding domain-containing protein [Pedobacter sp.]|nr:heavy metal translocating P-type ATPase metal-binding domain-containing protein [Pedobacter sp.]
MLNESEILTKAQCFHCGEDIVSDLYQADGKGFCCLGCKTVYQVLKSHDLAGYYVYNDIPGQTQNKGQSDFAYLDVEEIVNKLVDYQDDKVTVITLYIPAIHCSSCIWLLENLHQLKPAISGSRVDFLKKQVIITFKNSTASLKEIVETLAAIGYAPITSLQDVVKENQNSKPERKLIIKIAVAGFCFGNVMLLSFPEYFGLTALDANFKLFFGWLNLAFSVPVVCFSGIDYFKSAFNNLKARRLNLDFPLALGITVMFVRSVYEILLQTGPGFVDTLSGLVFFLLIGKWMQQRTFNHISFERDYRSYFPVAVTTINNNIEKPIPLSDLKKGDRILIRSQEIIPADAILLNGEAEIDFSFVTGESVPVKKVYGEIIYAGGRQLGGVLEMEVIKPVAQSYLTQLWNNDTFQHPKNAIKTFSDTASKYFSVVLLMVAFGSALFWSFSDPTKALASFTAVLIIACPCALALSSPFTLAAIISVFDKNGFYLKNTAIVEELARVNTFVFDKTGTITNPDAQGLTFVGHINDTQTQLVNDLARNSGHPLSRELCKYLNKPLHYQVDKYTEKTGRGISGTINGNIVKLGSSAFLGLPLKNSPNSTTTHIIINNDYLGYFQIKQQWRTGFKEVILNLAIWANTYLLSGDSNRESNALVPFFQDPDALHFNQSPQNKLDYVTKLQDEGKKVAMIGDGLNDSGALKQSNIGIAVTDNINNFSPSCDAVLDGKFFQKIPQFIQLAKDAVKVIYMSFAISLTYNITGLFFAVQGMLSPLIAAILMPLSTITIILFTTIAARAYAHKNKLI